MLCPICGETIDEAKHKLAEKLMNLGYMHLDVWLKCPKCKYAPAFGREMEDTKPVYFYPNNLPFWYRQKLEEAFGRYIADSPCIFCGGQMELHKIWVNIWKKVEEKPLDNPKKVPLKPVADRQVMMHFQFLVPTMEGDVSKYFLPSGILGQYKCVNWRCKYVRYVTV